jgi:hypothetical protein
MLVFQGQRWLSGHGVSTQGVSPQAMSTPEQAYVSSTPCNVEKVEEAVRAARGRNIMALAAQLGMSVGPVHTVVGTSEYRKACVLCLAIARRR